MGGCRYVTVTSGRAPTLMQITCCRQTRRHLDLQRMSCSGPALTQRLAHTGGFHQPSCGSVYGTAGGATSWIPGCWNAALGV